MGNCNRREELEGSTCHSPSEEGGEPIGGKEQGGPSTNLCSCDLPCSFHFHLQQLESFVASSFGSFPGHRGFGSSSSDFSSCFLGLRLMHLQLQVLIWFDVGDLILI